MSTPTSTTALHCALLAGGLLLAAATMPLAEAGVLFVLTSFMAGLTLVLVSGELDEQADAGVRRAVVRAVLAPAAVAGAITIGLAAVATISVLAALLILLALLCCSLTVRGTRRPALLRLRGPRRAPVPLVVGREAVAVPRQRTARRPPPRAGDLSDQELCVEWAASYTALRVTTSAAERRDLVEWRRSSLVHLEERDPAAVTAWWGADARAASDLSGYFSPGV